MEGLENGYDSYSVVRPHPPSDGSQESDMDEEEQARLQAERRAEKRRRKEERAARKARKASKRSDRDNAEQGVEGVSSSPVDRAIAEVDRDEVEEEVNGEEVGAHGRHDESQSQKTKKKKKSKRDDQVEISQQPSVTTHDRDDDVDVDINIQELPSAQPDPSSHTDSSSQAKKRKSRPSEAVDEVPDKSSTKKAKSKKAVHPPTDVFTEHADPVLVQPSSSAAGPSQTNVDRQASPDTNGPSSQNGPSSSKKKAAGQSSGQSTSTPRPKTPKASGTSAKGTPRKEEKETDDELRRKFRDQGAMNAWSADQWRDSKELQRLEGLGILKCVRGKFTSEEKAAIKAHFESFKRVNRIDDHESVDLIMAKGRGSQRKEFPKFWPEVAAQAPGRPVKAVKDFVKREFDPRGYKGAWTPEEDEASLRAYSVHPNEWAHIANIVDRTETDCRDRYRNELVSRDTRTKGHWDRREEQELVKIIKEVNEQVGNDPLGYEAPWDIVSERMGGKRSRTQCRKKWQEQLRIVEMSRGEKSTFQNSDRGVLIQRLKRFHVDSEKEINWQSLCNGYWTALPVTSSRAAFWRMKKEIPNQETMGFDDSSHALEVKYPVKAGQEPKERRVSSLPMIQSDHEDDPAEYESEEGEDGAEVDAEV